jgi:hypothetical protein
VIVINQNYGQLGNRLFLYAHLLAYAMETRRSVYYPGFAEHSALFPELCATTRSAAGKNTVGCRLPASFHNQAFRALRRVFHSQSKPMRLLERASGRRFHLQLEHLEEVFYPDLDSSQQVPTGICFFEGWAFRVHKTFQKHQYEVRRIFRFSESLTTAATATLAKAPSDFTVGVHIRMGDYQKHAPQWVYPKEFWYEAMGKIRDESGGTVNFYVVSDDADIDFSEKWIIRHRGSYSSDLALLAQCDFVLGPPSTFNRWAAFAGDKRHYCAWNSRELPSLEKFQTFKLCCDLPSELAPDEIETVRWFGIV